MPFRFRLLEIKKKVFLTNQLQKSSMYKALILGAGYGTRLQRDLDNDDSGTYDHLKGVPKPLLPIGDCPLVTHWMKTLQGVVEEVYIITNASNHASFVEWSKDWPKVQLVCDGSVSNETRIGAVGCMNLATKHFSIDSNLIVIAGDTLFYEDFSLTKCLQQHSDFQKEESDASMLLYVTCTDQDVHKYGILETDQSSRVTGFLEKPLPTETTSRKECPCFYFLSPKALSLMGQFLEELKDAPLKSRDATGNFIAYLYKRVPVFAAEISGRFDVGGLASYVTCHEHFLNSL